MSTGPHTRSDWPVPQHAGVHRHGPRHPPRYGPHHRRFVSRGVRRLVYALGAALWLSGGLWLLLHTLFAPQTAFGPAPHPWESPLMRLHGAVAVACVFLLGFLLADHVLARWPERRRRLSGALLGGGSLLLVVSGYALYYTIDTLHQGAALVHEALGVGALALALAHWRSGRARRREARRPASADNAGMLVR